MIILCDLDHCLSDAAGRDHLIAAGDWDAYHSAAIDDPPVHDMIDLLRSIGGEHDLWGLTGRNEKWRALTNGWLLKHGLLLDDILMRPDDDFTPAAELKIRMVRERLGPDEAIRRQVLSVLDDREDVLAIFAAIGVTTLQVTAGRRT